MLLANNAKTKYKVQRMMVNSVNDNFTSDFCTFCRNLTNNPLIIPFIKICLNLMQRLAYRISNV